MPNQSTLVDLRLEHIDLGCSTSHKRPVRMFRTGVELAFICTCAETLAALVGQHLAFLFVAVDGCVDGSIVVEGLVGERADVA